MARVVSIVAVGVIFVRFFMVYSLSFSNALTAGPNTCSLVSSGSDTSSDNTMYVAESIYSCSPGHYEGYITYEAYSAVNLRQY